MSDFNTTILGRRKALQLIAAAGTYAAARPGFSASGKKVRLGYFPNLTHAQPLLGVPRGDYKKALGEDVEFETLLFNAGPSVIEAVFGGELDISYIGPSPILNGYVKSRGQEVRVVAGAALNGVLIIARKGSGIKKLEDLRGKKIATPQLGNTQDISARHYVQKVLGEKLKEKGGKTEIIPVQNPDIEGLFAKGQLDAAWVPEPWGSRLIGSGLAELVAEERDLWPEKKFALTSVIVRKAFLDKEPELVERFLGAHEQLTLELAGRSASHAKELADELKRLTKKEFDVKLVEKSLPYIGFSSEPNFESFQEFFKSGSELGFLKSEKLDLQGLVKPELLEKVRKSLGEKKA